MGKHPPTSEYRIHWKILTEQRYLKAVLHAHPPALVAMSVLHDTSDPRLTLETALAIENPGLTEYAMSGTEELVEHVGSVFQKGYTAAVLKNHGVFLGSSIDLFDAYLKFEQLDFNARIQLHAGALGQVRALTEEQIRAFKERKPFPDNYFERELYTVKELELRRELKIISRRAYGKKLFTGLAGSISARVKGDDFLVSPAQKDNAHINETDFVLIQDGKCEMGKIPDAYAKLYQSIYQKHPQVQSIILASPVFATTFAVTEHAYEIGLTPESLLVLRDCVRIPFETFLNDPDAVAEEVGVEKPFCIIDNVGILLLGTSPLKASDVLEVAESNAQSIHLAYKYGKEIKTIV